MKTAFNILNTVFLSVGVVLGAGYVSGSELVGFFGVNGFIPFVVVSGLLFCLALIIVYKIGREYKGINAFYCQFPKRENKFFYYSMLISSFVLLSGMLAGLDSIWNSFFPSLKIPVLSILALVFVNFISARGIKCLEKINLVLVPIIIIVVNVLVLRKNNFNFAFEFLEGGYSLNNTLKSILYVAMNVFVSFPVLCETAVGKSKKEGAISAFLVSVILTLEAVLILGTISYAGDIAINGDMPLFIAIKGEAGWTIFASALFFGIITSIISSYYPLYIEVKKGKNKMGTILLSTIAFIVSRLGLKTITEYLYPLIGGFGVVFLIRSTYIIFKAKNEKKQKVKSIIKKRRKAKTKI